MAVQRLCTIEDKPFLRALWQRCFGDTDSFLDYYYDNRFYPEYTVCTIEDDKLVNAMYSFVYKRKYCTCRNAGRILYRSRLQGKRVYV